MKLVILLAAVIACSLAAPEPAPYASDNQVHYHFYCRRNPNGRRFHINEINANNLRNLFDPSLETIVLFHGWQDNYGADSNTYVRSRVLQQYNVNVIKVDWGPLAGQLYLSARNAVPAVGRLAANMVRRLNQLYNYQFSRVTVIGFSLGAHAAGNLGAALNGQVGQIIGLDPAGPLISYRDTDFCLDPTDARYVHVIHTNTDFLGMLEPIGHSDYYPNGGGTQVGCGILINNACSHDRAWEYLVESFSNNRFVAVQCPNNNDFSRGRCSNNGRSLMGGFHVDQRARGTYYLSTNRASPFGMG